MAFLFVTVTCISLCKKYRKWVFSQGEPIFILIYISIHPIPPGFFMHFKKVVTLKPGKRAINCKTVLHQIHLKQFN